MGCPWLWSYRCSESGYSSSIVWTAPSDSHIHWLRMASAYYKTRPERHPRSRHSCPLHLTSMFLVASSAIGSRGQWTRTDLGGTWRYTWRTFLLESSTTTCSDYRVPCEYPRRWIHSPTARISARIWGLCTLSLPRTKTLPAMYGLWPFANDVCQRTECYQGAPWHGGSRCWIWPSPWVFADGHLRIESSSLV